MSEDGAAYCTQKNQTRKVLQPTVQVDPWALERLCKNLRRTFAVRILQAEQIGCCGLYIAG